MSRAHSYAQIPLSDTSVSTTGQDSSSSTSHRQNLALARSQKSAKNSNSTNPRENTRHGQYSTLQNSDEDEDEDEDRNEHEDSEHSSMLRPGTAGSSSSAASSSSSRGRGSRLQGSAPRRALYDDGEEEEDNDNEISVAPPIEQGSSSSSGSGTGSGSGPGPSFTSTVAAAAALAAKKKSGARTTNKSFLARLTGRQRPDRDAQRMVRSAVDGVFSNLSAKPRVEKPYEEELPPAYKTAAMDVSPAYHETNLPPGFSDEDDMLLVEGLPVGGLLGFLWNMIISMSFQFVGFFLTYLLHTSHSTKEGSKTGLGITLISMGYKMMTGRFPDGVSGGEVDDEGNIDPSEDSDTGYMGSTGPSTGWSSNYRSPGSSKGMADYEWLSYILLVLGMLLIVQAVSSFTRVKLSEIKVRLAALNTAALEEITIPASAAAGASSAGSTTTTVVFSTELGAASGDGSGAEPSNGTTGASGAPNVVPGGYRSGAVIVAML